MITPTWVPLLLAILSALEILREYNAFFDLNSIERIHKSGLLLEHVNGYDLLLEIISMTLFFLNQNLHIFLYN